jgi:hypothetical protein
MLASLQQLGDLAGPDLRPGIHRQLAQARWWQAALRRASAPWPSSLPVHGLALATCSLLVMLVVALPRARFLRTTAKQDAPRSLPAASVRVNDTEQSFWGGRVEYRRRDGAITDALGRQEQRVGKELADHAVVVGKLSKASANVDGASGPPLPQTTAELPSEKVTASGFGVAAIGGAQTEHQPVSEVSQSYSLLQDRKDEIGAQDKRKSAVIEREMARELLQRTRVETDQMAADVSSRLDGSTVSLDVTPEHQVCHTDADCRLLRTSVSGCHCDAVPVNVLGLVQHGRRIEQLRTEYDGVRCDLSLRCPSKAVCISGRCTEVPTE